MDGSGFSFASYFASSDDLGSATPNGGGHSGLQEPLLEPEFPPSLVRLAKHIKAIRESRAALLDPILFGEPAWDILLALYVASGERYALSISALCAESGAPATTAARAISRLIDLGMVRKVPNPSDNRSAYVELTWPATTKLTELLSSARSKYQVD